ncbi:MAG: hypothetical protein K0R24_1108 [Gammaproteobacteria bacterium]|jgi:hypothetical protein|nr:hypothetical protein [Gammaproteobacteria bacterium]
MSIISEHYLDNRLEEWADWLIRYNHHGLGYPSKTIEARLRDEGGVLISGTGIHYPPSNERAEEMERLVVELDAHNKQLATVLRVYYLDPGLIKHKAKKANVSFSQFKVCVKMAKTWLSGRLSARN